MKDCFILGAGFSCAYSDAAPGMVNFLEKAREKNVYKPRDEHKELAFVAERYFGSAVAANIEALASFLKLETAPYPLKEPRATAYDQLMEVILGTLNDIYSRPRDQNTKDLFAEFARNLVEQKIHVITLNYDLLLDQLLKDTAKWFPLDGYGVDLPLNTGRKVQDRLNRGLRSTTALLKLHGSLNWGKRYVPHEDGSHPIEMSVFGALPEIDSPILPIRGSASTSGFPLPTNHRWSPYIIPPLTTKLNGHEEPLIQNIWYHAREVLSWGESVHILGYSLPPSDFEMEVLLREGLYSPLRVQPKKRVFFVNSDLTAGSRMRPYETDDVRVDTPCNDIVRYLRAFVSGSAKPSA